MKPNATKEEIEKIVQGEYGQMFSKQVQLQLIQIANTAQRIEAKKALEDIQNKHLEVVKIEKTILELQQLFVDMAVMISAQGEVIDQIAVHVENAIEDTEKGGNSLQKAIVIQRSNRKVLIYLIRKCVGLSF